MHYLLVTSLILILSCSQLGTAAAFATQDSLIEENNAGVNCLNANKFDEAIVHFQHALKIDPKYALARTNLAIAHNNLGLVLSKNSYKLALSEFEHAYYIDPNLTTRGNIMGSMEKLDHDFTKVSEHLKFADDEISANDLVGAYVQLEIAYQMKADPQVKSRLQQVALQIKKETKLPAPMPASLKPLNAMAGINTDSSENKKSAKTPYGEYAAKKLQATEFYQTKDYAKARDLYQQNFDQAQAKGNDEQKLFTCVDLHGAIWRLNRAEALKFYDSHVELAYKVPTSPHSQQYLFEYATELQSAKEPERAHAVFQEAFNYYKAKPVFEKDKALKYIGEFAALDQQAGNKSEADALRAWMDTHK